MKHLLLSGLIMMSAWPLRAQQKLIISSGMRMMALQQYKWIGITCKGEPYRYAGWISRNQSDSLSEANKFMVDSIGRTAMRVMQMHGSRRIYRVIPYDSIESLTLCRMNENIVPFNRVGGGTLVVFGLCGVVAGIYGLTGPDPAPELLPVGLGLGGLFIWAGILSINSDKVRKFDMQYTRLRFRPHRLALIP